MKILEKDIDILISWFTSFGVALAALFSYGAKGASYFNKHSVFENVH
ncbi:hypothetical protein RCO48_32095 [Peribacillus frigoritolerans]|nr:hypothetical protein [Peribacillus frigoritolerans]